MSGSLDVAPPVSNTAPDPATPVTLAAFLARTGAVLRAGWPDALWVEATIVKVAANAGGHALELIDPGPRGVQAGQLRAFLPGTALAAIRREMGLAFDPPSLSVSPPCCASHRASIPDGTCRRACSASRDRCRRASRHGFSPTCATGCAGRGSSSGNTGCRARPT